MGGDSLGQTVVLTPSPASKDAVVGEAAVFRVTVSNTGPLARTVTMLAQSPPAEWTYNFTPMTLFVPAGGANNTTLVVHVPSSAPTNATVTFTFKAQDSDTDMAASPVASVNITTQPRPPAPAQSTPRAPALDLSVTTGDQAVSGETAQGFLTLLNSDTTRASLSVELSIAGASAWSPRIRPEDQYRILPRGGSPVTIPLLADVPHLAENETRTFTVTARLDSFTYTANWTVLGVAASEPPAPTPSGTATSTSPSPSSQATAQPTPAAAPVAGMSVIVVPQTLDIAPGESTEGVVRVSNTGTAALRVTLAGSAADSWPIRIDPSTLDIAPGEAKEARMTVSAPLGIPVGGLGAGAITATTNDGLVRNAPFRLLIVEPSLARDETQAAAIQAPVSGDGGAPGANAAVIMVAAALGTVGAGALALSNRPLREKLVWAAVGLYTRLARPDILGHEDREKLYRLVETQPGIHFHALQRDLSWNTGTLTYHLRVLEKHGFMVSRRDGLYRRFYVSGAAPRKELFENQGPQGLRADVLEAVRNQHGISQSDLALALGANKQTVNYHVKALERQGVIRVEKRGRDTYLYPTSVSAAGAGEVVA